MATDRIVEMMLGFDLGVVIALVIISIVALIVIKKGE